jgi:hypothetical protein
MESLGSSFIDGYRKMKWNNYSKLKALQKFSIGSKSNTCLYDCCILKIKFSAYNGVSLNTIKMIMARFVSIYLACRYVGETYLMFTNDGRQMIKLLAMT